MLKLALTCLTICNKSVKICFSGNICQVWRGRQDRLRASRDICLHFLKYPPFQHNPARSKELSEERDTFGLPRSTNRLIHFFCQKGCLTSVPYTAGADAGADNDPIWFWLSLDHIFLFFVRRIPLNCELWSEKAMLWDFIGVFPRIPPFGHHVRHECRLEGTTGQRAFFHSNVWS